MTGLALDRRYADAVRFSRLAEIARLGPECGPAQAFEACSHVRALDERGLVRLTDRTREALERERFSGLVAHAFEAWSLARSQSFI